MDLWILTAFLGCMFVQLYTAWRRIGIDRRTIGYQLLTVSVWVVPLVLWFDMTLLGVRYTYDGGPDLSFSRLLHPIHFYWFVMARLGPSRVFLLPVVICPLWLLVVCLAYRRRFLQGRAASRDRERGDR